jgi:hypothetical protein
MSPILRRHWRRVGGRCNGSAVWKRVASGRLPRGAQDGSRSRFRLDKPSMPGPCGSSAARRPPNLACHRRDRQRREGGYQQQGDGLQGPQPSTPPNRGTSSPTTSSAPGHRSRGAVEIVPLPDAMDGLIDYYRHISGEHPDWDDYRRHGGTATCAHPAVNRPRRPRPHRVAANSSPAKPHDAVRTRPSGCTCSDRPAHL